MTKKQILKEIDRLEDYIDGCNIVIDRLRSYGASWALDCREMQINKCARDAAWQEITELKEQLKTV